MHACMYVCMYVCVCVCMKRNIIALERAVHAAEAKVTCCSIAVLLEHPSGCHDFSTVVTRHVIVYLLLSGIVGFCTWICTLHCFIESEVPL